VHDAVVDEPQAPVTTGAQQLVCFARVDESAEQVRDLAPGGPRLVVLEPARVGVQQQCWRSAGRDLLVDAPLPGNSPSVSHCSSLSSTSTQPAS